MSLLSFSFVCSARFGLTATLFLAFNGCAAVIGIEETSLLQPCGNLIVDDDEACDGGEFCDDSCQWLPGYDFSCMESDSLESNNTIAITHLVLDLNDQGALSDTSVAACGPVDSNCSDAISTEMTDVSGEVVISVPSPFQGSFEFRKAGFINLQKFRNNALVSDTSIVTLMLSQPLFKATAEGISGAEPKADTGHITVEIQDCQGVPAPDFTISLSNETGASVSYFDNARPSVKTKTTFDGRYAAINVNPGSIQVVASREDGVSLEGSVVVRAPESGSEAVPFIANLLLQAAP